ncbi:MAG: hypothetical protein HETSPECPRED_002122 [Heterodermia speciosa]|uniref:RNase H type-1 domain-containing protein n=1 Tax=Heterodermia speciosa TaxID=116794 RepID=A0A8H3J3C5_9LECA|nr:MAG: hypothetical protein HETSPECPRED_002122 [Heterodermia speciosa]
METLQSPPLTREPSPTPSDSSIEFILDNPSLGVSTSNDRNSKTRVISDRRRKARAIRRSRAKLIRQRKRLETRLEELIADDQNRSDVAQLKEDTSSLSQRLRMKRKTERAKQPEMALLESRHGNPEGQTAYDQNRNGTGQLTEDLASVQEWSRNGEVGRAMRTKITPDMIQTIELPDDWQDEIDNQAMESTEYRDAIIDTRPNAFVGYAMIQDRKSAVRQSLSEYTDATQRNDPGRHSFHVDAAISRKNNMTGLAVVNRTHRQDRASPWTAQGYRIYQWMDQNEAEPLAIWQPLVSILERIQTNRKSEHLQEPWSVVAIYSDSQLAVGNIRRGSLKNQRLMRNIAVVSRQLSQMQVEIELHWEPGHCNLPGNELADIVSKKARLPP